MNFISFMHNPLVAEHPDQRAILEDFIEALIINTYCSGDKNRIFYLEHATVGLPFYILY